ncbi:septum formation family protein [Actinomadura sp. NTSP31]|uniref:DUF4190 domain-containing protein n=1 Tax=Actinomadura sp. NTSP31 TaxID=1735447 RepID=UPI0035C1C353
MSTPDPPQSAPPAPPVGAPPSADAAAPRRTNRFAIVALVTGLIGLVVFAIGFAIAAFVQTGRRGEKGRGLAIGALAASAVWIIAAVVVASVLSTGTGAGTPAASATKNGKPRVTTLGAGACFSDYEEDHNRIYVTITGCTLPHEGDIGAQITLPDLPYPGDARFVSQATKLCKQKTDGLTDNRYRDHVELRVDRPGRSDWEHGDRHITCVLHYTGSEELSAPLVHMTRGVKQAGELAFGDCVKTWNRNALSLLIVDCETDHEIQVYTSYGLLDETYPPLRKLQEEAFEGCDERAKKVLASSVPKGAEIVFTYPSVDEWNRGYRVVLCMVERSDVPLRHSLLRE